MTRRTGDPFNHVIVNKAFALIKGRGLIAPAGYKMRPGCMAPGAVKAAPVFRHVHVKILVRLKKRRIEISVLDSVSPASVKMTDSAIFARRTGYRLGNFLPVRGIKCLSS